MKKAWEHRKRSTMYLKLLALKEQKNKCQMGCEAM